MFLAAWQRGPATPCRRKFNQMEFPRVRTSSRRPPNAIHFYKIHETSWNMNNIRIEDSIDIAWTTALKSHPQLCNLVDSAGETPEQHFCDVWVTDVTVIENERRSQKFLHRFALKHIFRQFKIWSCRPLHTLQNTEQHLLQSMLGK